MIAAELAELWGVIDVPQLMESMTPEQLDFWVAKDAISPIGWRGVEALLAVLGAAMLSSKETKLEPDDIRKACIIHGNNWRPWEPPEEKPATAAQLAMMMRAAGG